MDEDNNQDTSQDSSQNSGQDTQGSGEPEVVDMAPRLVQEGEGNDPEVVDMAPRRVTEGLDPKLLIKTRAQELLEKLDELNKKE
jgi:hypothetical protein